MDDFLCEQQIDEMMGADLDPNGLEDIGMCKMCNGDCMSYEDICWRCEQERVSDDMQDDFEDWQPSSAYCVECHDLLRDCICPPEYFMEE